MSAVLSAPYQQQQDSQHSNYYSQQSPSTSAAAPSPSTSSRRARRPSGNNGSTPDTPQQQFHSPSGSSSVTTPRAPQFPQSATTSTTPTASPAMAYNPHGFTQGPPGAYPPRSSSHNRSQTATAGAPQEQMTVRLDDRSGSSRSAHQQQQQQLVDRTRVDSGQAATSSQSRRRQDAPLDSPRQARASSQQRQPAPQHSRSATAVGLPPMGTNLPREESTVINRIVVADPQEDIAREKARVAESRPVPPGSDYTQQATGLQVVGAEGVDDSQRSAPRTRQDHSQSKNRKETKFGDYILGQTLGEGEFGKVKMGWKRDGGVQVAIKLIRRETLGHNPSRLPKIYREIAILRGLQHPNIVRLHEMVETERHIGIILEYASGGELFDYILNHRYLKDNAARRLFAQLVSGVGYLHKKGIVHRDLKLENLLLDRNKNIIITDFGFANTFDPNDELGDEIESHLHDKEYVKSIGLDKLRDDGHRRGDLMQTSCGSPCYAAPELVVSDSLYTGRKVDVWSCGVILYAMLAGYLPFDDDPANPEGDNINLLYKYIVSTPLTFPEYVTPHARDLLKRILVPDPRKRADLFEVARHSWLSEYAHVVGFITSSTTTTNDIANTTVTSGDDPFEVPLLTRSASVREPVKPPLAPIAPANASTARKQGYISETGDAQTQAQRENKRRTVQLEYVAPQQSTAREPLPTSPNVPTTAGPSQSRTRTESQAPIEGTGTDGYQSSTSPRHQRPTTTNAAASLAPVRPGREAQRAVSDSTAFGNASSSTSRPSTANALGSGARLPSRGNSYGQPAAPTATQANAQGRFSQPRGKQYVISNPMPMEQPISPNESIGRPSIQGLPPNMQQQSAPQGHKSHKRSNTVGGITEKFFGKSGSGFFGGNRQSTDQYAQQRPEKSYPPVSMRTPILNDEEAQPRKSTESSRRTSFGFSRKNTDDSSGKRSSRRFSLFGRKNQQEPPSSSYGPDSRRGSQQPSRSSARPQTRTQQVAFGQGQSRSPSQSTTGSNIPVLYDGQLDTRSKRAAPNTQSYPPQQSVFSDNSLTNYSNNQINMNNKEYSIDEPHPTQRSRHGESSNTNTYSSHSTNPNTNSYGQSSNSYGAPLSSPSAPTMSYHSAQQQPYGEYDGRDERSQSHAKLQKNRKFGDAYETEQGHSGSSGAAKRVMDFFRKRGRARAGE